MCCGDAQLLVATCPCVSIPLFLGVARPALLDVKRTRLLIPTLLHFIARVQILEDRSLKLDNVTMEDVGEYSCEAENAVGVVVATGLLDVVGE